MNRKVKNYLQVFFPTPATMLVLAAIVIVLIIYFMVSQYSNTFIMNEGYASFDGGDQNLLVKVIFYLPWSSWIDRALDFVFWGVLAAIALIIAWSVGAAKTSFANHRLVEGFENFQESKRNWHSQFATALIIKVLLVTTLLYLGGAVLFKMIPHLSAAITEMLTTANIAEVLNVALVASYLFLALLGIAICVKTLRHTEAN